MQRSKIPWCEYTWNPITGCTQCSPGCANCYAKQLHDQRNKAFYAGKRVPECYAKPFGTVQFHPERLDQPLRQRKPGVVFVCSMSDLFHEQITDDQRDLVFAVMARATQHTFVVLTKRAEAMERYIRRLYSNARIIDTAARTMGFTFEFAGTYFVSSPLLNVVLGVTACNQEEWNRNSAILVRTPAAKRFVSMEPMLGAIDCSGEYMADCCGGRYPFPNLEQEYRTSRLSMLDGIILGGESGPNARPMHPDWARAVRDQCAAAGVAFFMKQMSGRAPIPDDLYIRQLAWEMEKNNAKGRS